MITTAFQVSQIVISFLTAVLLSIILWRTKNAVMNERWRRIHVIILVPMNVAFYLMALRRVTAVYVLDYPELGILDRVALPSLISALLFVGMIVGYYRVRAERESIEIREQFARHAGHELNTPLTIVLGHVENALDGIVPENGHAMVYEKIKLGGRRLKWIVENLMYTITLSSDDIDLSPLNMADVVSAAVEEMADKAAYRKASVSLKTEKAAMVRGNGRLLIAAVTNLIDNAIKFADDTDIKVTVLLYQDAKAVTCTVADNGIGIAKSKRKAIFDAFTQGDGSDTRPYGGLGIGLWIVQRVAQIHKGRVTVESEIGQGSTFRLILPRYRDG